jgi:hypothetical protein
MKYFIFWRLLRSPTVLKKAAASAFGKADLEF